MISTREQLHKLLDRIPEADLEAAKDALERLTDRPSLAQFLANAPLDDEPISPDEEAAVAEARLDVANGRLVSDEQIRREQSLDESG